MKTIRKRILTLLMAFALILEYGFSASIMTAYAETGDSSYPAVTLSETVDGVKVTIEAPEGAFPAGTTMSVKRVYRQDVFDAVSKEFAENGRTMSDAAAFDVTPHDVNGNEVQPRKEVKVTFSGTELDADDNGISVYRVSDDAKRVTEMDTSVATADKQQFATDHFTIYVEGGSAKDPHGDGSGSNHRGHPYLLPYGETLQLRSDSSSIFTETWYIASNVKADSLTIIDEDKGLIKNTNEYAEDTLVQVGHSAGFAPFKDVDLNFWIQPQRKRVHIKVYFKDVGEDDFTEYKPGAEERWAGEAMGLKLPDYPQYKIVNNKIYVLDGWYTNKECTNRPNATYDNITKRNYPWFYNDANIYGRYKEADTKYAIIYNGNADDCIDVPQFSMPKEAGSSVAEVRNAYAHRPGYYQVHGGWATEPNATEPDPKYEVYSKVDLATDPHAKNGILVLYAVWQVTADISYERDENHWMWGKITGYSDYITDINQEAKGSEAIPNKGYRFKEWRDSSGRVVSTEPKFVPERINGLYVDNKYIADFEPITYRVTFQTDSMTEVPPQTVPFEGKVTKPEDPASDSCTSTATWYTDKALTKKFNFDTVINKDMTLYAKWDTVHKGALTEVAGKETTCEAPGNIHHWTCKDCGRCYSDAAGKNEITQESTVIAQLPHVPGNVQITEVLSKPNCVARGEHVERIYCEKCNKEIYSNTVFDDPLGHDWGDWTVTKEPSKPGEDAVNGEKTRTCLRSGCDATETAVIPAGAHTHELIKVAETAPACTTQGKKEHYKCSICGELFWDADGQQPVADEGALGIPATGHNTKDTEPVVVGETAPTCSTEGRKVQLKRCSICGALVGTPEVKTIEASGHKWNKDNKKIIEKATCSEAGSYDIEAKCETCGKEMVYHAVDYAKGHTLTVHEAKDPTCQENGNIRYWSCDVCNKLFSDEGGLDEISREDTVLAAVERHEPGEAVQENRVDATATSFGHYDLVKRCIYCGEEILRMRIAIPKLEQDEYNLNVTTSVEGSNKKHGGSVAGIDDSGKGKRGKKYRLTAKPSPGFEFLYWLIGGRKYTDSYYNLEVNAADEVEYETVKVEAVFAEADLPSRGGVILEPGETCDLTEKLNKSGSVQEGMTWESADKSIAKVNDDGVITAGSAGQVRVTGKLPTGQESVSYAVVVEKQGRPDTSKGTSHKVSGSTYKVLSTGTVALTKAKNVKTVTVPATVKIGGKTFKVTKIAAGAFKGSKATKLVVKTKKLTKKSVKGCLKGSKIKTVKVSLGKKSVNKKYVKKYKKIFTKKNAGRKVSVK